ncbi:hypothetical protein BFP70_12425 [Thioclava sp. SK-1]|uniref:tellurite resistance TerB family protein n=1 Tax=Thioclava sp. SK-1 TaxID=1889770 RepID=UPI0008241112|nr:tellurite resistance TerB family protein [Thioclava sp. SK-1]OCX63449.1 hypothetical protein BFP70_12425 [Thioclava sp. SK-1]
MSFMGTLAKVAMGIAIAKGASSLAKGAKGSGGGLLGRQSSGGLTDMVGDLLGGKKNAVNQRSGGLGDLLESVGSSNKVRTRSQTNGGLSGVLGQLSRDMGGAKGGLGALLAGLGATGAAKSLGGTPAQRATSERSFGEELNAAFSNHGEPAKPPNPTQNLAAAILLKAMIQAAKADGKIDAKEQATLMDHLGNATAEEVAFVEQELAAPVDVEGLAKAIPPGLEAQAYTVSVMAIDLDDQAEADYLHALAQALGMDQQSVNHIHEKLGVVSLYA